MSDEIMVGEKTYISSKRASELSGYSQDYIGQLARGEKISAQRIGGLWYIEVESLNQYKTNADAFVPTPPAPRPEEYANTARDSIIGLDGKHYLSALAAGEELGYHADYVGQLARGGKIPAQYINHRWYVDLMSLKAHKAEKDRLMAAVQAESVGLGKASPSPEEPRSSSLYFSYLFDAKPLLPALQEDSEIAEVPAEEPEISSHERVAVPIRIVATPSRTTAFSESAKPSRSSGMTLPAYKTTTQRSRGRKTAYWKPVAAVGFVGVLTFVVFSFNFDVVNVATVTAQLPKLNTAAVQSAFEGTFAGPSGEITRTIGKLLHTELIYDRVR